jgi:nucleoside-diphosphate-sugar epimerase
MSGVVEGLEGRVFTVLGAAGFVGQRVASRLRAAGAEVFAPARGDPALWTRPLGHVVYAAGLTADYLVRPFDTVEAHVGLLARVLKEAQWESLVYLSSTRLYDSLGAVDAHEALPLRLDPGQPRHLYDLSKALGESLCHTQGQGRARVARLACVYEGAQDADGFLPSLLRQVMAAGAQPGAPRPAIEVPSSPSFERDYVHVSDVVEGLVHLALRGQHTIYNLASGENTSNASLFDGLGRRWACELRATLPAGPSEAPRIRIDRMREEFGWRPKGLHSVLDAMKETCP